MRRRAVIFDDNKFLRFYLWQFFDLRGYEVFTFPEPDLCPLHVVRECPCPKGTCCADLIISDVSMMGKNGIDYIEELVKKGCKQQHFALMLRHSREITQVCLLEVTYQATSMIAILAAFLDRSKGGLPAGKSQSDVSRGENKWLLSRRLRRCL
jgi:DNA-binding NarL/FixJ family response regulator